MVHAGLAPVLPVAGVHLNIVLLGVVVVTVGSGLEAGVIWAFMAGLTANLTGRAPLGSVPLELIAACLVTAAITRLLGRTPTLVVLFSLLLGSSLADLVELGILHLLAMPAAGGVPLGPIATAAGVNAALGTIAFIAWRAVRQGRMSRRSRG